MLFFKSRQRQFEQVVRAFSPELYRFAYWLSRDRFLADELVQETFARAWKAWDQVQDPDNPKLWLISILRNEHARLFERKQFDYVDEAPEELEIAGDGDHAALHALEDLIGSLPLALREAFVLQALGGYSCAEIAELLDTTEGAIMVRLTRARKTLQAAFKDDIKTERRSAS